MRSRSLAVVPSPSQVVQFLQAEMRRVLDLIGNLGEPTGQQAGKLLGQYTQSVTSLIPFSPADVKHSVVSAFFKCNWSVLERKPVRGTSPPNGKTLCDLIYELGVYFCQRVGTPTPPPGYVEKKLGEVRTLLPCISPLPSACPSRRLSPLEHDRCTGSPLAAILLCCPYLRSELPARQGLQPTLKSHQPPTWRATEPLSVATTPAGALACLPFIPTSLPKFPEATPQLPPRLSFVWLPGADATATTVAEEGAEDDVTTMAEEEEGAAVAIATTADEADVVAAAATTTTGPGDAAAGAAKRDGGCFYGCLHEACKTRMHNAASPKEGRRNEDERHETKETAPVSKHPTLAPSD